jgi:hypothetical protein
VAPVRYRARRVVGSLPGGSSRPLLADTDGGRFIVKLVHGPEGPQALAAEWLGHTLASALCLPTAELAAIELDAALGAPIAESELREQIERGAGTCLGLRELAGAKPASLQELDAAPDDFALRLLWLDVLLENPDRRAHNPNVLRWGASLVPIDYAAALPFHHDWSLTEEQPARDLGPPAGHIFERRAGELERWHRLLRPLLTREALEIAASSLPPEWLAPAAFATEARQRAAYVAYLWKRLRALDARYAGV